MSCRSEDMAVQSLASRWDQNWVETKLLFICSFAIYRIAVMMFMLREDQAREEACLFDVYMAERLLVSRERKPVRKVLLWASVRMRGKKLLRQVARLP